MQLVDKMPATGQFIVVWEFESQVYSETWRIEYEGAPIEIFDTIEGSWEVNNDWLVGCYRNLTLKFLLPTKKDK